MLITEKYNNSKKTQNLFYMKKMQILKKYAAVKSWLPIDKVNDDVYVTTTLKCCRQNFRESRF